MATPLWSLDWHERSLWRNLGLEFCSGAPILASSRPQHQPWTLVAESRENFAHCSFHQERIHVWRHPDYGVASWLHDDSLEQVNSVLHFLREQWRKNRFSAFLRHKRREAQEAMLQVSRLMMLTSNAWGCSIMIWQMNNVACFWGPLGALLLMTNCIVERAKLLPFWLPFAFCHASVIPGWFHIAWQCPHFAAGRPPEPALILAKRLGWALADEPKQTTLTRIEFLSKVRAQSREKAGFCDPGAVVPPQ